jgi:hypothetical protein
MSFTGGYIIQQTSKPNSTPKQSRSRSQTKRRHRGGAQYAITNYTYRQAKKLGVTVKPSTNKTKKIDVFKNNKKVASVGANGMGDFPTFMKTEGMESAKEHRRRYKMRHEKDRHRRGSRGWYADKLLW